MARPSGPKTRCSGKWTESKFRSFIKNNLRRMCSKWAPIQEVHKEARTRRGFYLCAGCKEEVPATTVKDGKRVKNVYVDHIEPIVPPETGFTTWDGIIDRMFCEVDNLQVLCNACHTTKSNEERAIATERRRKEKETK